MRIPSFFSKRRVRYRASELGVSSHSRIAEFTKNRSMIPGAIDESALLHVHTSYLTRYSADEFSALIGFPLFLVTSLYLLSRFLLRPLFTSSSSSSAFSSSLLSRALRRSRSYCSHRRHRCPCLFLSPAMPPRSRSEKPDGIFICGLVHAHNKNPPFPRGSKFADRRFRS